ncbi:MAG TPA: disulfide reductase [Firmicutes bacterium]|nr:MAG: disulfide reductase [Candidatus Coatesbacteria bacterium]RLC42752.1 MAG: disulfide reductase [Candidatus Coatesbacteria bacterium]HDM42934.1 disulfide reductase [Bacillota bacterium]
MIKYAYYPGCSLESTNKAYDISFRAIMYHLGIAMKDIDDWNCCGATAYISLSENMAFTVSARNLAIAEKSGATDVIAPCAACYLTLRKAHEYMMEYPEIYAQVNSALNKIGLSYEGTIKVKSPLEVIIDDVGLDKVRIAVTNPLKGLKVACYYGCQLVRPRHVFDDPEEPVKFEELMKTIGADPVYFPFRVRCCGSSTILTYEQQALRMSKNVLLSAKREGADIIATACPLCQINLDAYQRRIEKEFKIKLNMPVVFFSQLVGLALNYKYKEMALDKSIVSPKKVLEPYLHSQEEVKEGK